MGTRRRSSRHFLKGSIVRMNNGAGNTSVRRVHGTEFLRETTSGRGPDSCIDAVGMEGHGTGIQQLYDRAKQQLPVETDRATSLRQAVLACRKGSGICHECSITCCRATSTRRY